MRRCSPLFPRRNISDFPSALRNPSGQSPDTLFSLLNILGLLSDLPFNLPTSYYVDRYIFYITMCRSPPRPNWVDAQLELETPLRRFTTLLVFSFNCLSVSVPPFLPLNPHPLSFLYYPSLWAPKIALLHVTWRLAWDGVLNKNKNYELPNYLTRPTCLVCCSRQQFANGAMIPNPTHRAIQVPIRSHSIGVWGPVWWSLFGKNTN